MQEIQTPPSSQGIEAAQEENRTREKLSTLKSTIEHKMQQPLPKVKTRDIDDWHEETFSLDRNTQIMYGFKSELGAIALKPLDLNVKVASGLPNRINGTKEYIIERLPNNKIRVLTYKTFKGTLDIVTQEGSVHINTLQPTVTQSESNTKAKTQPDISTDKTESQSTEPLRSSSEDASAKKSDAENNNTSELSPVNKPLEYKVRNERDWHERTFSLPAGTPIEYQCLSSVEQSPKRTMLGNIASHSGLYDQFLIERLPNNKVRVLTNSAFRGTLDITTPNGSMRIDSNNLQNKNVPHTSSESQVTDLQAALKSEKENSAKILAEKKSLTEAAAEIVIQFKALSGNAEMTPADKAKKIQKITADLNKLNKQVEDLDTQISITNQRIETLTLQIQKQSAALAGTNSQIE